MEERNPDKIVKKSAPPRRPPPPCRLAKDSPLSPRAIVPPGKSSPSRVNEKPSSNKNTGAAIRTVPPPMTSTTRAESLPSISADTRTHSSIGTMSILDLSPRIIIDNIKETKSNIIAKTKSQNSSDSPTTQRSSSLGRLRNMIPQSISSRPVFTSTSTTHHQPAPTEQTRSRERELTPNKKITNTSLHKLEAETTVASTTTSPRVLYLKKQRSGPRPPPPKPRRKDESLDDPIYAVIKPQNVTTTISAHDPITPYAVHRPSAIDDGDSDEYVDMNVLKNKDSRQNNNNDDGIDDGIYVYANPWGNKTPTHSLKLNNNNSKATTEDGYTGPKKQLDDDVGSDGEDTDVYTDLTSNTLTDSHTPDKTTPLGSIPPTQLTTLTTGSGYITSSLKTQLNNNGDGEDDLYTDIIINSVTDSHEHKTTSLGSIPLTQVTKLTTESAAYNGLKTQLNDNNGDGEDDVYTDIIINSVAEHKAAAHQQLRSSEDDEMYVNFTQLKAS